MLFGFDVSLFLLFWLSDCISSELVCSLELVAEPFLEGLIDVRIRLSGGALLRSVDGDDNEDEDEDDDDDLCRLTKTDE